MIVCAISLFHSLLLACSTLRRYKIGLEQGVGVFVSIVSTKIPFKGTSKEYIGESDVISLAVQQALQQCALQLKAKLGKREEAKQHEEKKKSLVKYIPDVSRAVHAVLSNLGDLARAKRRCVRDSEEKVLERVEKKALTAAHFSQALANYVEKLNAEEGLEYQMQTKRSQVEDVCLDCITRAAFPGGEEGAALEFTNDVCSIKIL